MSTEETRQRKKPDDSALIKVFGVNFNGRERRIVSAKSMTEAARLIGTTVSRARGFGSQTRNAEEIELAGRFPGKVWRRKFSHGAAWEMIM